jgi:hypothetical protein
VRKMTLTSLEKPYEKAAEKRKQIGESTDQVLFKAIGENPRLSLYELAQETGWGVGKVDGSVKRLHEKGLIKVECFIKAGRRVKLVSAVDYEFSPDLYSVPQDILDSASWKDRALVYGLDRLTIGVSGKPVPEWDAAAVLKSKVPVKRVKENLIFRLPKKFVDFYALGKSIVTLSTVKDVVLLTVEGQAC